MTKIYRQVTQEPWQAAWRVADSIESDVCETVRSRVQFVVDERVWWRTLDDTVWKVLKE